MVVQGALFPKPDTPFAGCKSAIGARYAAGQAGSLLKADVANNIAAQRFGEPLNHNEVADQEEQVHLSFVG